MCTHVDQILENIKHTASEPVEGDFGVVAGIAQTYVGGSWKPITEEQKAVVAYRVYNSLSSLEIFKILAGAKEDIFVQVKDLNEIVKSLRLNIDAGAAKYAAAVTAAAVGTGNEAAVLAILES
jgi:hypothetical protein